MSWWDFSFFCPIPRPAVLIPRHTLPGPGLLSGFWGIRTQILMHGEQAICQSSDICWRPAHFKCQSNSNWTFLIAYFLILILPFPLFFSFLFLFVSSSSSFLFFKTRFFLCSVGCLGTHSINQAGFEFTEIHPTCLCLPNGPAPLDNVYLLVI